MRPADADRFIDLAEKEWNRKCAETEARDIEQATIDICNRMEIEGYYYNHTSAEIDAEIERRLAL